MPRLVAIALLSLLVVDRQSGGLKIVVVEGEGAVNIIQQKTATAPVVEVRDRNNLPVPGAVVTFAIEGGKAATFGGANTLSITTNAAGRAVASGFNPISSGAVHINITAAFQGQTVAASLVETNVMTAAEAAGASAGAGGAGGGGGAAAGGGAGAGGGGLSTGAIVGIVGGGAAAAAGGVVAAGGLGGGSDADTSNLCKYTVSPTEATVPLGGGSFAVSVTVSPRCDEPWQVTILASAARFITATPLSGRGNGTVTVTVAPFTFGDFGNPGPSRCDNVGVASTIITVVQPTTCGGR